MTCNRDRAISDEIWAMADRIEQIVEHVGPYEAMRDAGNAAAILRGASRWFLERSHSSASATGTTGEG